MRRVRQLSDRQHQIKDVLLGYLRRQTRPRKCSDILEYLKGEPLKLPARDVDMREIANYCRSQFPPILIMASHEGYYMAREPEDMDPCIGQLEHRAMNLLSTLSNLKRYQAEWRLNGNQPDLFYPRKGG